MSAPFALVAAAVTSLAVRAAPTELAKKPGPNRDVVSLERASELWRSLAKTMARVQGTISIDTELQGALAGSCSDIVVQIVALSSDDERHSVKAWGNLGTGKCSYAMFVAPAKRLRVRAFYGGGVGPRFPGDYAEVNVTGAPFDAAAGRMITREGELTYDFVK